MEHFVGYHSVTLEGPYFKNAKSKDSKIGRFSTAKPFREETLLGNTVWVIEGSVSPTRYRVVSTGIITHVKKTRQSETYKNGLRKYRLQLAFSIKHSRQPIDVSSFNWFQDFKNAQQNFSRGFTRISNLNVISFLESAWSGNDSSNELASEINEIQHDDKISDTTRKQLIDARLGQGGFRNTLEIRWNNSCAVTGSRILEILRASHIKPWRTSSNAERLNAENGLLLAAHLDALFDKGLISFQDNGRMLVSDFIEPQEVRRMEIRGSLSQKLSNSEKSFLRYHREVVFQRKA